MGYDFSGDRNRLIRRSDRRHSNGEYCHFLGRVADLYRILFPSPYRRKIMSTATIIGITMTVVAVAVYISYKCGWIK